MQNNYINKKLIVFTHCFPWDRREHFMDAELKYLAKYFRKITIIPMSDGNALKTRKIPSNVDVKPFLIPWNRLLMLLKGLVNLGPIRFCLTEIRQQKIFFKPIQLRNCLIATLQIRGMLSHPIIKKLILKPDPHSVFFFSWGNGPGYLAPFLPILKRNLFVRFHGGDLYEDRSGGYIPYRASLLKCLNSAIFISKNGQQYLHDRYRDINFNSKVFRLGVEDIKTKNQKRIKNFNIISCSDLLPVKRIPLIVEALALLRIDLTWTHIGGGEQFAELLEKASLLPDNITTNFLGKQTNESVREYYQDNFFDAFLNVSESEGVPVSIMEALAAGIPIIATNVGGTSEIVDEDVGRLLPKELCAKLLSEELIKFKDLPKEKHMQLRLSAAKKFRQKCEIKTVCQELANYLITCSDTKEKIE